MVRIQKQGKQLEDELDALIEMAALEEQGKFDEAFKLRKKVALPHYMGEYAKKYLGLDFLKNCGWNMSEVEAVYGKNYLTSSPLGKNDNLTALSKKPANARRGGSAL